jgi:bidirectional [NiFe] hydrogenase diaphorase subunit
MLTLEINGRNVQAEEGTSVLEAALSIGVEIPTLCYNEQLSSEGRCRMCMVEVERNGRSKLVSSCMHPVEEGLKVQTDTEKVLAVRKMVLELLLARNPEADKVRELAARYGVTESRFGYDEDTDKCILCGQCVRTCREVVGVNALGFSQRGVSKEVGTPFVEPSQACIGCGACYFVCPTGHIEMKDEGDERTIWGRTFKMQKCEKCGRYFAPIYQLEWISKQTGVPMKKLKICQNCK